MVSDKRKSKIIENIFKRRKKPKPIASLENIKLPNEQINHDLKSKDFLKHESMENNYAYFIKKKILSCKDQKQPPQKEKPNAVLFFRKKKLKTEDSKIEGWTL